MTLSKEQIAEKTKYLTHFWIWERDMHWLAFRYAAWALKAQELGYGSPWACKPWTHSDLGKRIKYMEIPNFSDVIK